ncbi:hypothetical protein F5X71_33730 [Nocardia brasiliensis]|uniref:RAMA domain-containing protein n=1 Tax=Nocardia brasiliensis TaxID=37326 RepID=A0A6G9Y0L4_NOCBR|nr:hypothetical protein [Nocardia brasiliensis]QIS06607.1 hypothetical protein F5X71_33730 [Nocardia brasiliensis]
MENVIAVDDAVYAALVAARVGFESPNDVLRRLLLPEAASAATFKDVKDEVAGRAARSGQLATLLDRGLIEIGDTLRHTRVRKGQVFSAEVLEGGLIRTEKGVYSSPSPALKALVGSEINGWHHWIHTSSEKTLAQLRDSL